ncbi:hypothetical protein DIC67_28710 [Klebsiella pneumoniae]|nr:hypothetical protein DIC67_28710 [Klebsiella pneumoniae]
MEEQDSASESGGQPEGADSEDVVVLSPVMPEVEELPKLLVASSAKAVDTVDSVRTTVRFFRGGGTGGDCEGGSGQPWTTGGS